ncbi:beta-galactosidase trimerization domain-containing protein [Coraliomargarita algicola]|uniref:Beta-galactosidase trimerization domain-containing protein n=1 Tax=Coraliomargarita algicola TaxID=3092156 RepID=A0ABZ0RNU1_9BACT|nr:beta-galactosidase trimerization domain-containing protein [Coraliomargarita sp. J2-16]WPJ96773.1 beta-galactosidase trimerization domain-containing protein [Coraliomargarita sp. J2-16]
MIKSTFFTFLLCAVSALALGGCNDETVSKLSVTVRENFPAKELRGYGTVSGTDGMLASGANLLTIECESPEKAELLQAKYLSDLGLLPQVTVEAHDFNGQAIQVFHAEGQGYIVTARKENLVRILSAEQRGVAIAGLMEGDWSDWSFSTETKVPMYLDRWDKWGFRSHFKPWYGAPKDYIQAQGGGSYDFLQEFEFAEEMGHVGLLPFNGPHSMDTAGGLDDSMWWEWSLPLAEERGLPYGFSITVAAGSEAPWLMNRYRDQEMQPMPQFGGSYMRIGSPYFGTRGTTSWAADEANQVQFDLVEAVLRRFQDRENVVTVLEPHGELKNLAHSIFLEYGPVADAGYQAYLQTIYTDLNALNRAWDTDFSDWTTVRVPEIASFAGWGEHAFDLTGEWKISYETLAPQHQGKDDLLYYNERYWVKKLDSEPAPAEWFRSNLDDSSWSSMHTPGDDQNLLTPSRPGVMRRHFELSQDWLDAREQVWLYVWDMNLASNDTFQAYVNDTLVDESVLELMQPHWTAVEVSEQLKAGDNLLALRLPKGKLSYRVYLSEDAPQGYPFFEKGRNIQWYDFAMWHCWLRKEEVGQGYETIRKVFPNRQIVQMAPDAYFDDVKELSREYGSNFHNTGYMSAFYADMLPALMRGADLPFSLEPGGPAKDLKRFKSFQGLWMSEGVQAIDYFIHIGSLMWDPEIRQHLKDNLNLFELIGKYHSEKAEVAGLYSSESTRLNGFPWVLDPNKLLSSGYWSWNARGYLRDYYPSDALSESSFSDGDAAAYRVIIDSNTSIMSETMVDEIEEYVREGGTFITYVQTGRHSTSEADAWPIERLTGYRVEKVDSMAADGRVLESGKLTLSPGQDVLSGDWEGVRANGLHLRKIAEESQDVLLWDDGSVAMGIRPLGKGYIVQVGCKFSSTKIRDRLEPAQRSFESLHALPEGGDDALTNLLVQLMEWRDVASHPFAWEAEDDGVLVSHYLSNNGLYDFWVLWNTNESKAIDGKLQLRDRTPAWCLDMVDESTVSFTYGGIDVSLEPEQTRVFMTPRGQIENAPADWFTLQRNWWRGTKRGEDLPAANVSFDNMMDLTDGWAYHVLESGEHVSGFTAKGVEISDWPIKKLSAWKTAEWPEPKTIVLRKEFTLPEDWSGDVTLTLESKSGSYFVGEGEIFLDGKSIHNKKQYGMDGFTSDAFKPGSTHELAVVIQADSTLCGVRGNAWLWLWPAPAVSIDLAGEWRVSSNSLDWEGAIELPAKYSGVELFKRKVDVPASFEGMDTPQIYLDADARGLVGFMVNGHFVRRYHRITADRFQLNVTPWIRFGESNEIELVHYWRASDEGDVKSIHMRVYPEPY